TYKELGIRYNKDPITLRDSSALLSFGLGKLSKSFDVPTPKGEYDFDFVRHGFENIDYSYELFNDNQFVVVDGVRFPKAHKYVVFNNGKQIFYRHSKLDKKNITYWNLERHPLRKKKLYDHFYVVRYKCEFDH